MKWNIVRMQIGRLVNLLHLSWPGVRGQNLRITANLFHKGYATLLMM